MHDVEHHGSMADLIKNTSVKELVMFVQCVQILDDLFVGHHVHPQRPEAWCGEWYGLNNGPVGMGRLRM